ncbi:Kinesin-like protein kif17 [Elasticomyces elasticus]|nr:Kinesin-like protein kif17 [Elasticomyces elasticus]
MDFKTMNMKTLREYAKKWYGVDLPSGIRKQDMIARLEELEQEHAEYKRSRTWFQILRGALTIVFFWLVCMAGFKCAYETLIPWDNIGASGARYWEKMWSRFVTVAIGLLGALLFFHLIRFSVLFSPKPYTYTYDKSALPACPPENADLNQHFDYFCALTEDWESESDVYAEYREVVTRGIAGLQDYIRGFYCQDIQHKNETAIKDTEIMKLRERLDSIDKQATELDMSRAQMAALVEEKEQVTSGLRTKIVQLAEEKERQVGILKGEVEVLLEQQVAKQAEERKQDSGVSQEEMAALVEEKDSKIKLLEQQMATSTDKSSILATRDGELKSAQSRINGLESRLKEIEEELTDRLTMLELHGLVETHFEFLSNAQSATNAAKVFVDKADRMCRARRSQPSPYATTAELAFGRVPRYRPSQPSLRPEDLPTTIPTYPAQQASANTTPPKTVPASQPTQPSRPTATVPSAEARPPPASNGSSCGNNDCVTFRATATADLKRSQSKIVELKTLVAKAVDLEEKLHASVGEVAELGTELRTTTNKLEAAHMEVRTSEEARTNLTLTVAAQQQILPPLKAAYYRATMTMFRKQGVRLRMARVRPLLDSESEKETIPFNITTTKAGKSSLVLAGQEYGFDHILDQKSSNEQLFEILQPMVTAALHGHTVLFATAGPSNSGKTFTLLKGEHAVIPTAVRWMYTWFDSQSDANSEFSIQVEMVEVYIDRVRDLLVPMMKPSKTGKGKPQDLAALGLRAYQTTTQGGAQIQGHQVIDAKRLNAKNATEMINHIEKGCKRRHTSSTLLNETSSRSHLVLSIYISSQGDSASARPALRFVDLAGCELHETATNPEQQAQSKDIAESTHWFFELALRGGIATNHNLTKIVRDAFADPDSKIAYLACVHPLEEGLRTTKAMLDNITKASC